MWINSIFVIIVFIVALIGFTGYSLAKDNTNNSALDQLSRAALVNKLEQLPETPIDINEPPVGAMCYDTAAPLERSQYICPVCGEMTLYPAYSTDIDKISYYRTLVKKIKHVDVKLDESQLCEKCSPNSESRKLCLIVKPKSHKNLAGKITCGITEEDINLIYEYSEGMKEHTTWYGKFSLNNYKNRLEELFGAQIDEIK